MPKIEFGSGFANKSSYDFNKLTLEQGEKARICVIESPTVEYVHVLQAVVLDKGKPIMREERYGRNGDKTRQVPETNYIGRFLCLGDYETLQNREADPDNCPICKAAVESPAVEKAKPRFGAHVIKYQVKKGSFTVQEPFQVELAVWDFTPKRYDTLKEIFNEHGALPQIDLNLGPCENKGYQKYDIVPGAKAAWMADAKRQAMVKDVLANQKVDDLALVLGRRIDAGQMRGYLQDVFNAWNLAFGTPGVVPAEEAADTSGLDLDIFGDSKAGPSVDAPVVEETNTSTTVDATSSAGSDEEEQSLEDLLGVSFK